MRQDLNLRKALKQLHPRMILACGRERHRAENWPSYLERLWLRARAKVETNIYNNHKIEVVAQLDDDTGTDYLTFNQVPLTELIEKLDH